ncbi:MAG: hypothetical protein HYV60_12515 [Planctomycetia bacterium]|nr:hypothetical protein [Planctomycetia bacterium]
MLLAADVMVAPAAQEFVNKKKVKSHSAVPPMPTRTT